MDELIDIYEKKSNNSIFNQMNEYFDYLATGIMNLFLIFDLDCVIVGGIWAPYENKIKPILIEKIKKENCKLGKNSEKIIFPKVLTKASAIGAGIIPFSNIYDFNLILRGME